MNVTMRYGSRGEPAGARMGTGGRNLLSGISWTDEYLGINAAVTAATDNGEKLTDFIDISNTSRLLFIACETANFGSLYVPVIGLGYYDESKTLVSPTKQTFSVNYVVGEQRVAVQEVQIPDTCSYLRLFFRTFGDTAARATMIDVGAMAYVNP